MTISCLSPAERVFPEHYWLANAICFTMWGLLALGTALA